MNERPFRAFCILHSIIITFESAVAYVHICEPSRSESYRASLVIAQRHKDAIIYISFRVLDTNCVRLLTLFTGCELPFYRKVFECHFTFGFCINNNSGTIHRYFDDAVVSIFAFECQLFVYHERYFIGALWN